MSSIFSVLFCINSAITVVAATLDVHPGVAVPGAGLSHLEPLHHEVLVDVVDEAGRRFPAVHHPGETVATVLTPTAAVTGLQAAHVSRLVLSRPVLLLDLESVGIVGALDLSEVDQLGRALDPRHVHDGGVGAPGTSGSSEVGAILTKHSDSRAGCWLTFD